MALPESVDVVVVGAGMAGLAAAGRVAAAGRSVLVLEAGDAVGGRVRTDEVDGLLIDRGFQLLNPAYPEAARVLDLAALRLRPFLPGVVVVADDLAGRTRYHRLADPRRHRPWAAATAMSSLLGPADRVALLRWGARLLRGDGSALTAQPDVPVDEALLAAGISPATIRKLLRPFLTGVLLDEELAGSRRVAEVIARSFLRGTPAVPDLGMQRIPEQLAAGLPSGTVRLRTPVHEVRPDRVVTDSGPVRAGAVVVAADPLTACRWLGLPEPAMRPVLTWWWLATPGELTGGDPVLLLDGDDTGPLTNAVVISNAAPSYAPGSRPLVCGSAAASDSGPAGERAARQQLSRLLRRDTAGWELVSFQRIAQALPAAPPPHDFRRPVAVGGCFVAGDHRDSPSLQGALVSGRRAADAALARLGSPATGAPA